VFTRLRNFFASLGPGLILNFAVPHVQLNSRWLSTVVGVLGTTITPYLFFWQASLMVEEEKEAGNTSVAERRGTDATSIATMHTDVNTGMIYSNLVALFIIVTTAATLGAHGITNISTAQQAALALRPRRFGFARGSASRLLVRSVFTARSQPAF
jgi:Mn2+/Fe2+ NRAMP family transporter